MAMGFKLGSMTTAQTGKANNLTSQLVHFAERRNTGDVSDSGLEKTRTYDWDAQRAIEFQVGDLTYEIDIFVKRNDR